jgi:hypothetical protein
MRTTADAPHVGKPCTKYALHPKLCANVSDHRVLQARKERGPALLLLVGLDFKGQTPDISRQIQRSSACIVLTDEKW